MVIVAVSSVAIHSETLLAVNRRDRQVYDAAWRQFLAVLVFPLRSFQAQTFGARPAVLIHFVSFSPPPLYFVFFFFFVDVDAYQCII